MFCVGDSVVYGLDGICTITAVSSLDLRDVPKDKLYYTLRPMDTVGVIYVPVDAAEGKIRKILTREKAVELIEKMPSVAPLSQVPEKGAEVTYRECLQKYDYEEWIRLIKYIYNRKQERQQSGKRMTMVDEKYMKLAENVLYQELAVALGIPQKEVLKYIIEKIENENQ